MSQKPCANPLFTGWLKEILDKARERNTKGVNAYHKAWVAMRDCPIVFEHPSEAKILSGIGDKLVKTLEDKLKAHCEEEGLPMPKIKGKKKKKRPIDGDGGEEEDGDTPSPPKKARKLKPYVPGLRTGAYAIVLALSTLDEEDNIGLTKQQVISEAEEHCDSSFTVPSQANKHYTAWNSMKTLTDKNMVYVKGGAAKKYLLTDDGWDCAKSIMAARDPTQRRLDKFAGLEKPTTKDKGKSKSISNDGPYDLISPPGSPDPRASESPQKNRPPELVPLGSTAALPAFTPITIRPGSFTIRLVLDNREVRAKQDRDFIQKELYKEGVEAIVRPLSLGDTIWVAQMNDKMELTRLGAEGDEIQLDYILERKRLDDLVASIKDRRFMEQKFRLRKTGVKNVIYLIEQFDMHNPQDYQEHIKSAIASTQVVNGFFVKKTRDIHETVKYLARMTKVIKSIYESKTLHVIPTPVITSRNYLPLLTHLRTKEPNKDFHITSTAFSSLASKSDSLTLRDVYLKMLMCTRGITGEKAIEIQKIWKTPRDFAAAYEACGDVMEDIGRKRRMELVSGRLGNAIARKKIAKVQSVKIAEIWGDVNAISEE